MYKKRLFRDGIELKKKHGQHFLNDEKYIYNMIDAVVLDKNKTVVEVGCGAGILTKAILETDCKKLNVFEIDPEWADYVRDKYGSNEKLNITLKNILDVDLSELDDQKPLVMLANLPYQITFPILYLIQKNKNLFSEGVVMVQEEVAQKIVKTCGRGYGFSSLFLQHSFDWRLLDKVSPEAFDPPPKVFSRLLYFKLKDNLVEIKDEQKFWKFIKLCFIQPRRTLKNNLAQSSYDLELLGEKILKKRAQELSLDDLLGIWDKIN